MNHRLDFRPYFLHAVSHYYTLVPIEQRGQQSFYLWVRENYGAKPRGNAGTDDRCWEFETEAQRTFFALSFA
jgi:hypothetical protein